VSTIFLKLQSGDWCFPKFIQQNLTTRIFNRKKRLFL
jgi:hypothetical protein